MEYVDDLDAMNREGIYLVQQQSCKGLPNFQEAYKDSIVEVFDFGKVLFQRLTVVSKKNKVYARFGEQKKPKIIGWTALNSYKKGKLPQPKIRWNSWEKYFTEEEHTGAKTVIPKESLSLSGKHLILQQNISARKGGKIGTGGRAAIALRFDDGALEFKEMALSLLEKYAFPFTRVTTSNRVGENSKEKDTFESIQNYVIHHGGEVWNHGVTHTDAPHEKLRYEILGGRNKLRRQMPRIPIDCFAPPGGDSIKYEGHMPSDSPEKWGDSYAGKLILENHGLASGYLRNSYFRPLDGIMRDGQTHYSLDSYNFLRARDLINRAVEWKMGVVLMWHMNSVGQEKKMSFTDFKKTLEYIAQLRDQGALMVLTVSGLGVADRSICYRDNILPISSGNPFRTTITHSKYRQNVSGSTRELSAQVNATPGSKVMSRIGESRKYHEVPESGTFYLRHVATIPLDEQNIVVEIDADAEDVKLLAV
ncbi:polysaccharide deacetylase family protein [Rothia sp. P13129]|uniref:polysaccharide deacetylase family protein n=1 Tax=Rothia sp. P13129 TaxID=3402664 RepID=UPI003ABEFA76